MWFEYFCCAEGALSSSGCILTIDFCSVRHVRTLPSCHTAKKTFRDMIEILGCAIYPSRKNKLTESFCWDTPKIGVSFPPQKEDFAQFRCSDFHIFHRFITAIGSLCIRNTNSKAWGARYRVRYPIRAISDTTVYWWEQISADWSIVPAGVCLQWWLLVNQHCYALGCEERRLGRPMAVFPLLLC